jgi:hypothetical protein
LQTRALKAREQFSSFRRLSVEGQKLRENPGAETLGTFPILLAAVEFMAIKPAGYPSQRAGKTGKNGLRGGLPKRIYFSETTLLVTGGTAFYNPSKTACEAVIWFTHHPGIEPPTRTVVVSARACLNNFGISQEH